MGSPPLARGIHVLVIKDYHPVRITPACAGNTVCNGSARTGAWDHPRLRGEYCDFVFWCCHLWGSPPLARGILVKAVLPNLPSGITPACAGNTRKLGRSTIGMKDHPRLRGEYARAFAFQSASTGSPPLARGIPSGVPAPGGFARITPACAGNTEKRMLKKAAW